MLHTQKLKVWDEETGEAIKLFSATVIIDYDNNLVFISSEDEGCKLPDKF